MRILLQSPTPPIPANNALAKRLARLRNDIEQKNNEENNNRQNNNYSTENEFAIQENSNSENNSVPMSTFYSNAPLSVQEEFNSVKERLEKGETSILKIYKMTSDYDFIKEINGIPVVSESKLIEDLNSWSTNERKNTYFLRSLTELCSEKLRDMYIQGGLEQSDFLFLLFTLREKMNKETKLNIAGFSMLMLNTPYYVIS